MRDLEQAKAEVFRRSDARIKKRKAIRRNVIACCVPLVLCIGIWSVTVLPAMMPAQSADCAESAELYNGGGMICDEEVAGDPPEILYSSSEKEVGDTKAESSLTQGGYLLIRGEKYPISAADGKLLYSIVKDLPYHPYKVCKCLPQFKFETEDGRSYGLHLSEGYARCDKGQAALSEEQILQIRVILARNGLELKEYNKEDYYE